MIPGQENHVKKSKRDRQGAKPMEVTRPVREAIGEDGRG